MPLLKLKLKGAGTLTKEGVEQRLKVTGNCQAIYADGFQVLLLFTQGFIAIYACREAFLKLSGIWLFIEHFPREC